MTLLDPGMYSRVDTCSMAITESPRPSLRSGELAQAAGISSDTLRHYERLGILKKPPRTDGGYRAYPADALDRVNLIRNALASGFTLRELTTILQVRDGGGAPCQHVAELAREKVNQLEIQITQLARLRDSLKLTIREWDVRLKRMPKGGHARLLESLPRANKHLSKRQGENHEDVNLHSGTGNANVGQLPKRNTVRRSKSA
jgi:DNA-binding transcriptional MerR regulator